MCLEKSIKIKKEGKKMKKSVSTFAAGIIGLLLLCGCGGMALSTTN